MTKLFLDQDLKPSFEKIAMPVKLSDNHENWQREIASEIFKQLPFLADFAVNVVLDRVDPQRGYAFGSAEVTNITDAPIPDQPQTSIHVPIIVKERLMQPLDVMLDGKEALPLNERRLREKLFRTSAFELSTRKPTDQGMVDQLYPPMRTNYGYGNSVSTGAGVGGFGKQASLCEAIAPTLNDHAFDWLLTKLAEPEIQILARKNPDFLHSGYKVASAEPVSVEKTAQALVQSIAPTVVQLTKLASGNFKVKWANAGAFAPQEAQVDPAQAGAMAGADLSGMQPGQTMTVTTQRAQKQGLDEPDALPIKEFGDYIVKDADTGATYQGTVLPVVDFQMQPLPLFVFTDGAGHYATQDEVVGIRMDGPGGMALGGGGGETTPPELTAQSPGAAPNMPKMAERSPGTNAALAGGVAGTASGLLSHHMLNKATTKEFADAAASHAIPLDAFSEHIADAARSNKKWAIGLGLGAGALTAIGAYRHQKQKHANAQPQGDGIFVYHPQGGAKPFCTQPITIKSSGMDPSGAASYMAEDVFGATMQLVLTPGLMAFEPLDEDNSTIAIPDDMQWVPLQGQAVHLDKGDAPDAAADAKSLGGEVAVKSTGPGEVSMDGMPLAKVARDQRWFLKTAEAVFLLSAMGLTQEEALATIKEAESRKSGVVKLAGLNTITPLSVVHEEATKKASALLKQFDYSFWSRDLVKEAAALEDSETADKVLAMNFINPENIGIFASYLPELDATSAKLAEMLLASRLGMNQVPEGAAERAMKNLEEVIQGLRALQQKQLI